MTDRLFKFGSVEQELMKSMEKTLVKNQKNEAFHHDKFSKAVDLLNSAAALFDNAGFNKEAEVITTLIEKLANGSIEKMIEESLPEYKKSPVNRLIEEEKNKKDIEDLINRDKGKSMQQLKREWGVAPSKEDEDILDQEIEAAYNDKFASKKKL